MGFLSMAGNFQLRFDWDDRFFSMIPHKTLKTKGAFGGSKDFSRQSGLRGIKEEDRMFYPVKILNSKGKVKKVVAPKSLSQRYWGDFFDQNIKKNNRTLKLKGWKTQKKTESQKDQNMSYEDIYFSEN